MQEYHYGIPIKRMVMEYDQDGERISERRGSYIKILRIGGVILIVVGGVFFLEHAAHVSIFRYVWPVILVIVGVGLVLRQSK